MFNYIFVELPLFTRPYFEYSIKIYGTKLKLKFSWNNEGQYMSVNFYSQNGVKILSGVKILTGWNLLRNYQYNKQLPNVMFYAYHVNDNYKYPEQHELGNDFKFGYIDDITNADLSKVEMIYD